MKNSDFENLLASIISNIKGIGSDLNKKIPSNPAKRNDNEAKWPNNREAK